MTVHFTINGGVLLTMSLVYFSVVRKVIATQLLIMIVTGSYTVFEKRELVLSICKTLRVYGVHRNVTRYSPVLQRFSAKANELSRALILSYSWHKANCMSDLCSCPLISFQELICLMKTRGHFSGNFPFLKNKY